MERGFPFASLARIIPFTAHVSQQILLKVKNNPEKKLRRRDIIASTGLNQLACHKSTRLKLFNRQMIETPGVAERSPLGLGWFIDILTNHSN